MVLRCNRLYMIMSALILISLHDLCREENVGLFNQQRVSIDSLRTKKL